MIKRSLVGKLWLAIVVLVVLVMFFLGLFLSNFFEDFYFSLRAKELARHGEKMAHMIGAAPYREEWQEGVTMISHYIDARVVVTDRSGLIRTHSAGDLDINQNDKQDFPDVEKILNGEIVSQRGNYPGINMTVISVGVPIKVGNEVIGAIFLNAPVEPVTQNVRTVQKSILYGALGTILLATILAFIVSKRITKPILDMNRVAMEMAKGNFEETVTNISNDEIGLLGKTINYLSAELQENLEALSNEKEQLENILTSMSDAVITLDEKGNVLLMNPPAKELKLSFESELISQYETALEKNEHVNGEVKLQERVFKTEMTPLRSNGDVRGVVAVLHDVTREHRLEELRREFVANVSHELRSPLSLLQGYVEALTDGLAEDEEARNKYLNIVLEETLRLRRLVNDLLDLTQLETGHIVLKFEEVSLTELVNRVTGRFKPLFADQKKELSIRLPENLPPVWGDEDRLHQVLVNLLDNAVKYTPEGGEVSIGAEYSEGSITVSVSNAGVGIPKVELANIWERFYKVDKARTRETDGGTGLGLSIVKNIVLAHGGEVGVTSEAGQGTTFVFSVKTAQAALK